MARKKSPRFTPSSWQISSVGLGTGVLLALAGGFILVNLVQAYEQAMLRAKVADDHVTVVYAARDLNPGVVIQAEDVFVAKIPGRFVHADALRFPELVVGRYTRERVYANEALRPDRMSNPEDGEGLNAIIPHHMRALSIELSDGAALGGHLEPGNYVDMLATFQPDDDLDAPRTLTTAQQIFVLAVNDRPVGLTPQETRMKTGPFRPSVTLLVSPQEAERIVHADRDAVVRLTLRNDLDKRGLMSKGVDVDELLAKMGVPETADPAMEEM